MDYAKFYVFIFNNSRLNFGHCFTPEDAFVMTTRYVSSSGRIGFFLGEELYQEPVMFSKQM